MTTILQTTCGKPFTVDDEDAAIARQFSWRLTVFASKGPKPQLHISAALNILGQRTTHVPLRQILMGSTPAAGVVPFCIDGNPCCLEKKNLVWLDLATLRHWTAKYRSLSSFRGVSKVKVRGSKPWRTFLGGEHGMHAAFFGSREEAALAYDRFVRERYGAWARVNFPSPADPVREGSRFPVCQGPLAAEDGTIIKVDSEYIQVLSRHAWKPGQHGYWTEIWNRKIYLAYLILGKPGRGTSAWPVWLDGDTRNCTKTNLAWQYGGRSHYRGVQKIRDKWNAKIRHQGQLHYLGVFDTQEEAARAYDAVAVRLLGNKARLNFSSATAKSGKE